LRPAIKDVLGDAADENILNAWGEAYWVVADVLKSRDHDLYANGS
jgi:nitric oxide dioxygenase